MLEEKSKFQHEGLHCRVLFVNDSHHCGYVAVPSGHPVFGKDYSDLECDIEVHGGLTYASKEGDFWVLGFDCAHSGDATKSWPEGGTFRTVEYVEAECRSLAEQLVQRKSPVEKETS